MKHLPKFLFLFTGALALGASPPLSDIPRMSWRRDDFIKKGVRSLPWIRDPFSPDSNKFEMTGVISGELAFVNGRWLKAGDRIQGYVVKEVNSAGVALYKDGEITYLRLRE